MDSVSDEELRNKFLDALKSNPNRQVGNYISCHIKITNGADREWEVNLSSFKVSCALQFWWNDLRN